MDDPKLSDVLDTEEAAQVIGVSPDAVVAAYRRGKLPGKRIGQRGLAIHRKTAERYREQSSREAGNKGGRPKSEH